MTFLDRGHERRRWLNTSLGGLLDYYIGPTGIPDRLRAVNQLFNPINDLSESMASAREASKGGLTMYERAPHMLNSLTSGTAFAAPMIAGGAVATRNADDIARYLEDAFTGVSIQAQGATDAGRRFAADEYGGIKAYHGSPHDFDEFRMDKIGTGEGAQAYGHGLYFAENEGVARSYRDALASKASSDPFRVTARAILAKYDGDKAKALDHLRRSAEAFGDTPRGNSFKYAADALESGDSIEDVAGRMYEVEINANPEDFLDWEGGLADQPPKVREWFESRGISEEFAGQQSGNELFQAERRAMGDEGLAKSLKESGIAGVRYLDHGSRFNAMDGIGPQTNTRNYVVFDERLISIVRKYGIAGAAAMLGVSAQDVEAAISDQGQGGAQ